MEQAKQVCRKERRMMEQQAEALQSEMKLPKLPDIRATALVARWKREQNKRTQERNNRQDFDRFNGSYEL